MITEKNIYASWKRRFAYPTNKYGKKSSQFANKVSGLRSSSFKKVCSVAESAHIILAGTDGLSIEQTKKMIQILDTGCKLRRLFVTSRFSSKQQAGIDKYMNKKMNLEKLLEKITDNWLERENFGILFRFLQRKKIQVYATGCNDFAKEDQKNIKEIQKKMEGFDQKIFWMGPARMTLSTIQSAMKKRRGISLYFQLDDLRWKFPKSKNWQAMDENEFVDVSVSPIVALDDFNSSMEYDDTLISIDNFETVSSMLMKKLSTTLGQKKHLPIKNIFHVFTAQSIDQINRLQKDKNVYEFLKSRILAGESATLPKQKSILLATRKLSHLSEEVAHYLRTAHRSNQHHGQFSTIVEEAFAFFASLLVNPNRRIPQLSKKPNRWDQVHAVGYDIGIHLFRAWNRSKKMRKEIRVLWNTYPSNEIESELLIRRIMS